MGSIILSTLNRAPEELLGVGASLGGVSTRTRTTPETITVLSSALGDTVLHEHPSGVSDEGIPHFTCDTTALRYARIEVEVTVAGAAGAKLRLQYRVLSVGGTWLSAGGSGGEVAVTLSATGDLVVGGSVPLTALCTGDCEFRVVAVDGDGSASPCIGNLYVKFMDIPLPASTAPQDNCIIWDAMAYADVTALEAAHPETDDATGGSYTWDMETSPRNSATLHTAGRTGDLFRTVSFTGLVPNRTYSVRMHVWQDIEGAGGILVGIRSGTEHNWYEEAVNAGPGASPYARWVMLQVDVTADSAGDAEMLYGYWDSTAGNERNIKFSTILLCGDLTPPGDCWFFDDFSSYANIAAFESNAQIGVLPRYTFWYGSASTVSIDHGDLYNGSAVMTSTLDEDNNYEMAGWWSDIADDFWEMPLPNRARLSVAARLESGMHAAEEADPGYTGLVLAGIYGGVAFGGPDDEHWWFLSLLHDGLYIVVHDIEGSGTQRKKVADLVDVSDGSWKEFALTVDIDGTSVTGYAQWGDAGGPLSVDSLTITIAAPAALDSMEVFSPFNWFEYADDPYDYALGEWCLKVVGVVLPT